MVHCKPRRLYQNCWNRSPKLKGLFGISHDMYGEASLTPSPALRVINLVLFIIMPVRFVLELDLVGADDV